MTQVFLSHSSEDAEFALKLATDLRAAEDFLSDFLKLLLIWYACDVKNHNIHSAPVE